MHTFIGYRVQHTLTSGASKGGLRYAPHVDLGEVAALRALYLTILWTHIPLAASIAFLVPRTFLFAIKGDFAAHKRWAKFTFPIWYYVSVTGVLVYFFLYQWWPAIPAE